jgi:TBC1 domain family member 15
VNELSTTIDLESTLIRAEALFRRFQRTVEAIDKKSNFPAPKLRQRITGTSQSPATEENSANTSSTDTVTAGSTNNGSSSTSESPATSKPQGVDKGKGKAATGGDGDELKDQKPKVISPELRELLNRKVVVLPRKVVRKEGEGLAKVGTAVDK